MELKVKESPGQDDRHTRQQSQCTVCKSTDVASFFEIRQVPVHCNLLWATRDQAIRAPKGDIQLGFCRHCGHIFNLAFDSELMAYTQDYENSLHFSPRFRNYAQSLATRLIERHDLHDRDLIEIGCGRGDFLRLLCKLGGNRGVGFDPSHAPQRNSNVATERITFIQDFYSERYADYEADFICCRHVLEHIQFPREFLSSVRGSIAHRLGTVVFFEVPNVLFTLRDLGIWDLIYEHCSYFGASSLSRLFTLCGFDICHLIDTYRGQFLCIEASPGEGLADSTCDFQDEFEGMARDVATFADKYRNKLGFWQRHLEQIARSEQRAVVWGAGSKGVTFLNALETQALILYAVDINPRKQGMYLAGTGQRIVPPEFLQKYQPDVVIVMNPIYKNEIQQLIEGLGLTSQIMCA
jgi:SAM-dependent methyltransferase